MSEHLPKIVSRKSHGEIGLAIAQLDGLAWHASQLKFQRRKKEPRKLFKKEFIEAVEKVNALLEEWEG